MLQAFFTLNRKNYMLKKKYSHAVLVGLISLPILCSCSSLTTVNSNQQVINQPANSDDIVTEQIMAPPPFDAVGLERLNLEEKTLPEPDADINQEIAALEALGSWDAPPEEKVAQDRELTYDFPITINRQVEFYLDFFSKKQQKSFARWLTRSGRYVPLIKNELQAAGLPLDLAYLPMIESGFSLTAYSKARAVGPWQFIRATGKRYGLTINKYVDERRDPEKSTKAAISYLKDLYDRFQSWPLAVAGYNAGEGKIHRAIKKYHTNDFWKLAEKNYLKLETKRYVPKLIAAIIIAKNPAEYGFPEINYAPPLEYETLTVPRWTSLRAIAVASETTFEKIHNLNRQLRRAITPPDSPYYTIKVPAGKGEMTVTNLPRVKTTVVTDYKTHKVRKGETLSGICRRYNLHKTILLKANDLRSATLTPGKRLRIPYQTTVYTLVDGKIGQAWSGPASPAMDNLVLHKIKPGETLSAIARKYHVPMHLIAAWNDITDLARIRQGDQLALYLKNNLPQTAVLAPGPPPGQALSPVEDAPATKVILAEAAKKRPALAKSAQIPVLKNTYYKVRGGDSLWKIAQKFRITPAEIRQWNKLESNLIHPGRQLLLKINIDTGA